MTENPAVGTLPPETQSVAFRSGSLASQIGVLTALFLFLYGRILASLIREWWTREESSHGFLVLPVCVIILWANRRKLKSLPIEPSCKAGILTMGAAAFFLILVEVGGIFTVGQMSLIMMLAGLVLTLLGVRFLTALRFPLSYLLFMMPSLAGAVLAWN
jgi:exosortase